MVSLWGESLTCRTVIIFTALTSDFQRKLTIRQHIVQLKAKALNQVQRFSQNFKPKIQIARLQVTICPHRHQTTGDKFPSVGEIESVCHVPCILKFHSIERLLTRLADVKNTLSVPYLVLSVDVYKRCTDVLFCACQAMTFGGNLAP